MRRGIPGGGVTRWRYLLTWRERVTWSNVASADVESESGISGCRKPRCVAGRGVRTWRRLLVASPRHLSSPDRVLLPGVRGWTRGRANGLTPGVTASLAHAASEPRGVVGRGVSTRRGPGAFRQVSSECVFGRRAICAPPQATPLIAFQSWSTASVTLGFTTLRLELVSQSMLAAFAGLVWVAS